MVFGRNLNKNFRYNSQGMVGHLQVFALSNWYSVSLPAEYSDMTRGLWWLIPRERLPWNKDTLPIWSNHSQFEGSADHLEKNARDYISKEERRLFSYVHSSEYRFSSTPPLVRQSHDDAVERIRFAKYGNVHQSDLVQKDIRSKLGVLSGQENSDIASVASVPPLSSEEYFIYFLVRI